MLNHIAFIPDGNRRWARKHGVSIFEAYERGVSKIHEIVDHIVENKIARYVTFYVLSLENVMNRNKLELDLIYNLLVRELKKVREDENTYSKGIRVRVIGIREILPEHIVNEIELTEKATERNENCTVILAVAYSGVLEPFHVLLREFKSRRVEEVLYLLENPKISFRYFTYLRDVPRPDVIVRTGGEKRISNFLLPHAPGAKLIFLEKYWPEITPQDIDNILSRIITTRA